MLLELVMIVKDSGDNIISMLNSVKNYNCKILHQTGRGFGNALIEGMNNVETEYLCIFNQ